MSLGQEKSTQAIYNGSLLSQELHPIPKHHWVSTMQSKSRLQHHAPKKCLEHLKPHTSFGKQHHKNQNTLWFCTYTTIPKTQKIEKGLHLINIQKEIDYIKPFPLLCENPKAWCKSWKLKSVFSISKCLKMFLCSLGA